MNTGKEIWKCIPFLGIDWVQVSNLGRCRTIDHEECFRKKGKCEKRVRLGRILNPTTSQRGRKQVYVNGKLHLLHRLVAMAFVENTKHAKFVTWKDGNRQNNNASNLIWVNADDVEYSRRESLVSHSRKIGIFKNLNDVPYRVFRCMSDAGKFLGLTKQAIHNWLKTHSREDVNRSGFHICFLDEAKVPKIIYS